MATQGKKKAIVFFSESKKIDLIRCFVLVAAVLQVGVVFAGGIGDSNAQSDAVRRAETEVDFSVGNIAGVKIAIPKDYLSIGPNPYYKVVPAWHAPIPPPSPRDFENEIEEFGIVVKDTDAQPIKTKLDKIEFKNQYKPSLAKREYQWITVVFQSSFYSLGRGNMRSTYDGWIKDDAGWGPWISQKKDVAGLKHFVSGKQDVNTMSYSAPDEFFYDSLTNNTFINCTNRRRAVPPFDALSDCKHQFDMPELRAQVSIHYPKDDLPRWKELESLIRNLARTFIIQ